MFFAQIERLASSVGKTVTSVVLELGYSKGSMSHWKKGNCPSGDIVVRFADYFDVTTDYLLGRESVPIKKEPQGLRFEINEREIKKMDNIASKYGDLFAKLEKLGRIGAAGAELVSGMLPDAIVDLERIMETPSVNSVLEFASKLEEAQEKGDEFKDALTRADRANNASA